jgi:isopentenyldiphosphate isomerase
MGEPHDERVAVFDAAGRAVGGMPREEAKRSGLAVGAINLLLVSARGEVLLQQRPADKENGGRWDKSVGGHVDAGEGFDAVDFERRLATGDLGRSVVFRREALQLNLRDVRLVPGGGARNVVYHVASYLGRTDVPLEDFRPPAAEIAALRYAAPGEVDALLLAGGLAPNMAFLWLTHARALLALASRRP